jgi:hypothetical protein
VRTSEQTNEIAKALALAQSDMKNAALNKVNPHFKSRYADLAAIRDVVIPAYAKHGVATTQGTEIDENGFRLVTRLSHSSGQWMECTFPLAINANPQAMGSQISYARRYTLSGMGAISADEDDDAEGAATESKRDIGTPRNAKTTANGEQKSAYRARKEGDWSIVNELASIDSLDQLKAWYAANKDKMEKMPANWQDEAYAIYDERMAALKMPATMAG